jgi:hypothetical protein
MPSPNWPTKAVCQLPATGCICDRGKYVAPIIPEFELPEDWQPKDY